MGIIFVKISNKNCASLDYFPKKYLFLSRVRKETVLVASVVFRFFQFKLLQQLNFRYLETTPTHSCKNIQVFSMKIGI